MQIDLTGKRAIVTGASRGLGAAIVARMREAGAEVWVPTRSYDLRDLMDIGDLITACIEVLRPYNVLVNCAAVQGPVGKIHKVSLSDWADCLRVNLEAPALLCAAAVGWMVETKTAGSIINISGGGACNPRPGYSAYATSKAGLVRFSETIAEECREYGIRVNCVAPGTLGDMGGPADRVRLPTRENEKHAADCVCWLASDASRPITGKLISAVHDPWPELERNLAKSPDMYTLRRVTP